MKYGIDLGYDLNYYKNKNSSDVQCNFVSGLGKAIAEKLMDLGQTVVDCTPDNASTLGDMLYKKTLNANKSNLDVFLSISCKIGSENLVEVFLNDEKCEDIGREIKSGMEKIKFRSKEGLYSPNLYILKNSLCSTIILKIVISYENLKKMSNCICEISDIVVNALLIK